MKTHLLSLFFTAFFAISAHAAPKIESWKTASGVKVLFVQTHALPILDIQFDFSAGSSYDPPGKEGLAALTQTVLDMGVEGLDETALSNRLADVGALLSGSVDQDRAQIALRTLSAPDKRDAAIALFQKVITEPRFLPDVFAREKARYIAALKDAQTQPASIAKQAFWAAMYSSHAYGRSATPESVAALLDSDLREFHTRHYSAKATTISIVGDITVDEAKTTAEKLSTGLPVSDWQAPEDVDSPALPNAREIRLSHPAQQAHVLIGLPAIKRGDPDFFPLLVGNYSLGGGGFASRLMAEVREKRGLTYGVYSAFIPLAQTGPFQIALQTKQANDALKISRDVLTEFLANGPSESELKAAKQNITGSFPLRFDSNSGILANIAVIGFYGLPLDYLDHYASKVQKVTTSDVKAAFARHVKPQHMITVIVAGE